MTNPLARTIIKVSGYSDDLVEVEGCKGADEFEYPSKGLWRGDLIAPNGESMRVHVFYDECWHVSFGQVAEGIPFPEGWVFAWENQEKLYAVTAVINAPEGTRLTNVGVLEV